MTGTMPPYPVREVRNVLVNVASGGNANELPGVPTLVGGETDFLFGMAYNWFLPQRLFVLPTGLAIYESMFVGIDGSRGCIDGNHQLFTQCERQFLARNTTPQEFHGFLREQIKLYNTGIKVCLDYDTLHVANVKPLQVAVVNVNEVHPTPKVMHSVRTKLLGSEADLHGLSLITGVRGVVHVRIVSAEKGSRKSA